VLLFKLFFFHSFLRATRSIERISYGNVSVLVAGWLSVTTGIVSKRLNIS